MLLFCKLIIQLNIDYQDSNNGFLWEPPASPVQRLPCQSLSRGLFFNIAGGSLGSEHLKLIFHSSDLYVRWVFWRCLLLPSGKLCHRNFLPAKNTLGNGWQGGESSYSAHCWVLLSPLHSSSLVGWAAVSVSCPEEELSVTVSGISPAEVR